MSAWLAAAYAALALGLAWTLAAGRGWKVRALYGVCAPLVALALWLGRPNPAGWPTKSGLPAHAQLLWALVDEPDPAAADPGRIFLWVDVGARSPRAYSLPYSRPLHRQVQQALSAVRHGMPIGIARAARLRARGGRGSQHGGALRFYAHPPIDLPVKPADSLR